MPTSLLFTPDLWLNIDKQSDAPRPRLAAIAYVTDDSRLKFRRDDVLICDASTGAIRSGQTSANVLARMIRRGAEVYSYPGLHSKVIVFGDFALIGSANLSKSSRELMEAGIVTNDPRMVGDAIAFISTLIADERRRIPIKGRELARLLRIKVERTGWHPKMSSLPRAKSRVDDVLSGWVSHAHPMERSNSTAVNNAMRAMSQTMPPRAEVRQYSVGRSSSIGQKARAGERLILIWKELGNGHPVEVYSPVHIQKRVEDGTRVELLYYEPRNAARRTLKWQAFQRLMKASGFDRAITKSSVIHLSSEIIDRVHRGWHRS